MFANRVLVDTIVGIPDAETSGDDDGAVQESGFLDPVRPREFAGAVEAEEAGEGAVREPVLAGQDGGDAGVDAGGWGVGIERRGVDGGGADEDAGDVGEAVFGAGGVAA